MANHNEILKKRELAKTAVLCIFNRANGKIIQTFESESVNPLKLQVLEQGLHANKDAVIFIKESGNVVFYAQGQPGGILPKFLETNLGNIKDYSKDLLELVQLD